MAFLRRLIVGIMVLASLPYVLEAAALLRVGVTPGPHIEIIEFVKEMAESEGLAIDIDEFSDYMAPNRALDEGVIDLNIFQHKPFLQDQVASRGYKIQCIADSILIPMMVYSLKYASLAELDTKQDTLTIAIPNDPTNGSRALLLLNSLKVIELKNQKNPSTLDLVKGSNKVKLMEIDAAQLPRVVREVDAAVINGDWAIFAGLEPNNRLASEIPDMKYANLFVVRNEDKRDPSIRRFIKIYQSQKNKKFIEERFKGNVIPAW